MCRLERGFNVFMEAVSQFVGHVDSMIWSMVLVLLCLGVGLYLSIRMKFPQIRFLKEMVHLLGAKEESENVLHRFRLLQQQWALVWAWAILPVWHRPFISVARDPFSGCGSSH